jgi:hypothetical protein
MCKSNRCWGTVLLLVLSGPMAMLSAADGDPMAIRSWPAGTISLETHWGHSIAIHPTADSEGKMSSHPDQELSADASVDHVLTRLPNTENSSWLAKSEAPKDDNAVHVKSIVDEAGTSLGIELQADGVKIVVLSKIAAADHSQPTLANVDLLVISPNDKSLAEWIAVVQSIQPRLILLNLHDSLSQEQIEQFRTDVKAEEEIVQTNHNTLALSKSSDEFTRPRLVTLTTDAWQMPADLGELFQAMEKASKDSQVVFAKLSTNQMNFKPANGTHTPRWNTEHMMGRQLGFFSQIYHTLEPTLPVMDLNPKQMPPDYEFAHPDWSGQEEARQMERVSQYTRRFAYLLADLDLDKRAPGSRWPSLRALLNQMQRHYSEHTANTIKKFDLPEWPNN